MQQSDLKACFPLILKLDLSDSRIPALTTFLQYEGSTRTACKVNFFGNINLPIFFNTSAHFIFLLPTRQLGHVFMIFLCKCPLEYRILSKACLKPGTYFFF